MHPPVPGPPPPAASTPVCGPDSGSGSGLVVAVDGPSGSGKSSVSRAVARRLGLSYLDTGAMYRALAWWCVRNGIDLGDAGAVARAAASLPLRLGTDPDAPRVYVDGHDISQAIRESAISTVVSQVATNLDVRATLVAEQRRLVEDARAHTAGIVAEGRDITTVVAPDAQVRVLLVASEEARLRRRARQLNGAAGDGRLDQVRDEVVRRDRDDSTVAEFHHAAPGVLVLDTSDLTFDESVEALVALASTGPGDRR